MNLHGRKKSNYIIYIFRKLLESAQSVITVSYLQNCLPAKCTFFSQRKMGSCQLYTLRCMCNGMPNAGVSNRSAPFIKSACAKSGNHLFTSTDCSGRSIAHQLSSAVNTACCDASLISASICNNLSANGTVSAVHPSMVCARVSAAADPVSGSFGKAADYYHRISANNGRKHAQESLSRFDASYRRYHQKSNYARSRKNHCRIYFAGNSTRGSCRISKQIAALCTLLKRTASCNSRTRTAVSSIAMYSLYILRCMCTYMPDTGVGNKNRAGREILVVSSGALYQL